MRQRLPPVLRRRDFGLYWVAIVTTSFAGNMVVVAVGWQVYAIHRSALDLGLIGLMEFLPLPLLALPAGHLADRMPRKVVLAGSLIAELVIALLLLVVSLHGAHQLWPYLVIAALAGAANSVGAPAGRALPPSLVPLDLVQSAVTMRSIAFQVSVIVGPAVGGILFTVDPELVYGLAAGLILVGFACITQVREPPFEATTDSSQALWAGIRFIRETRVVLGAISLDLFAVLFGGMLALLPLYARSILHTGPVGLGILRTAPAVGALSAALILARRPLRRHVGRTLLVAVAIFGAHAVVFGFSKSIVLSCVALAVGGFVDMYSMNIRSTTVALATPNDVRGRVLAVEWVFISGSNELGAFESGLAAAILGPVTAVVAGGIATIGIAGVWKFIFPELAAIDRYDDLQPASLEALGDRPHPADSPA
jgi:MFS family permease